MLASLFLVGAFVSQITADLSDAREERSVSSLAELDGAAVGTVSGTSFEAYLLDEGINVLGYDSQTDAFEAASAGEVDFVVTNPFALEVLGGEFGRAQGSPWREPINESLADLQLSGQVQRIIDRWLS
jgi:ABC-type amino acid transport substrate-binding protein